MSHLQLFFAVCGGVGVKFTESSRHVRTTKLKNWYGTNSNKNHMQQYGMPRSEYRRYDMERTKVGLLRFNSALLQTS